MLVLVNSCGKFRFMKSSQEKQEPLKVSGTLKVAVFYEPGAEPYTDLNGALLSLPISQIKVWNVLKENLRALYPTKNIVVPFNLNEMAKLSSQNKTEWTYAEIKDLGSEKGMPSVGDETVLNVFFLKGSVADKSSVIGVHLSGTKTMAVFKDVVETSGSTDHVKYYVEQATLVHEVGHAIGLVNNGLPMTSDHDDKAHPAHCKNPDCVMYYMNEGAADLIQFVLSRQTKTNLVMFDQACIKDVTSHK